MSVSAKKDPVQVFLTYMQFAGDLAQTASVLDLDVSAVQALEASDRNQRSNTPGGSNPCCRGIVDLIPDLIPVAFQREPL